MDTGAEFSSVVLQTGVNIPVLSNIMEALDLFLSGSSLIFGSDQGNGIYIRFWLLAPLGWVIK